MQLCEFNKLCGFRSEATSKSCKVSVTRMLQCFEFLPLYSIYMYIACLYAQRFISCILKSWDFLTVKKLNWAFCLGFMHGNKFLNAPCDFLVQRRAHSVGIIIYDVLNIIRCVRTYQARSVACCMQYKCQWAQRGRWKPDRSLAERNFHESAWDVGRIILWWLLVATSRQFRVRALAIAWRFVDTVAAPLWRGSVVGGLPVVLPLRFCCLFLTINWLFRGNRGHNHGTAVGGSKIGEILGWKWCRNCRPCALCSHWQVTSFLGGRGVGQWSFGGVIVALVVVLGWSIVPDPRFFSCVGVLVVP